MLNQFEKKNIYVDNDSYWKYALHDLKCACSSLKMLFTFFRKKNPENHNFIIHFMMNGFHLSFTGMCWTNEHDEIQLGKHEDDTLDNYPATVIVIDTWRVCVCVFLGFLCSPSDLSGG